MLTFLPCLALVSLATPPAVVTLEASRPVVSEEVDSAIVHVGLFKNGLAVVRRAVTLPGAGVFDITDVPTPVHGTFWVESDGDVAVRVTQREVTQSTVRELTGEIQADLAGALVELERTDGHPALTGKLVPRAGNAGALLVLDTEGGRVYLAPALVASLRVVEPAPEQPLVTTTKQPVLELTPAAAGDGPTQIEISYLTQGLTWTPSYRVNIADPSTLVVSQKTVINNELADLEGVEFELISGFPSIEFSDVTSPLAAGTSLAAFFSQVGTSSQLRHASRGDVRTQIASNVASYAAVGEGAVVASADGVDMHYREIGAFDMALGDALVLPLAEGRASYERIVDWRIPDLRDANGRPVDDWRRQQDPRFAEDGAWDALRFENPFDFPMTTAPALIVDGHRFNGQRTSTWVNPGEETTLRITKALSVRTSATEVEEPDERELIRMGGRNYRKPTVSGEVLVCNHRKEPTTVVIRREFSGDLVQADDSPDVRLLEAGVYSINTRNELVWTLTLEPGETKIVKYRYSVLVLH